ncbi:MAG: hypothetical protein ACRDSP_20455 [Pseudonocardiaceae bacterium]
MPRPPYHYPHRLRGARGPVGPLLLVLGAVLLAGGMAVVVTVVAVLATLGPLVLAGVAAVAITSARRRHRRAAARSPRTIRIPRAQRGFSPPGHPVGPDRPGSALPAPDWAGARARFDRLRSAYGRFECDPLAVLRLPALTDVTVPSTGRFVDAFAEAQALDTETEPPTAHRDRFIAAVDAAWRTWRAAMDAAQRIRLAGIPAEERATVLRAIKLLTMARDSDHDAERITAYAKARAELAKLDRTGTLRLPPAAAAALDTAARGQLPPASVRTE